MGKEDDRHLWPYMLQAIRDIRPRYVVGENVRGLLSWSEGLVLEEVYADLEGEGYEVETFVLPAVGINAPHRRDRVWIVAKDASSNGRIQRESEQEGTGIREFGNTSPGSSIGLHIQEGSAADTNDSRDRNSLRVDEDRSKEMSQRRQSFSEHRQNSINGVTTDTERLRLELGQDATDVHSLGSQTQGEGSQSAVNITPNDNVHSEQGGPSEVWDSFPIKSPLCWGDDGLPTELDGLALPKWRKESIMGYGNAIVPQIAYRIFATINEIENR